MSKAFPFNFPYIAGNVFAPGPQPYNPGQSHQPWSGHMGMKDSPQPWPGQVPVLSMLASFEGVARTRAQLPTVNRYSPLPSEFLFLGDTVGKSQG